MTEVAILMCNQIIGARYCSGLGADPTPRGRAPTLPIATKVQDSLPLLAQAQSETLKARIDSIRPILGRSRDSSLRTRSEVHAQNAGIRHYDVFCEKIPRKTLPLDPMKKVTKF